MNAIIICLFLSVASHPVDEIDAAQFGKLMKALHGRVSDVQLVYEGEHRYVGPKAKVSPDLNQSFQGSYAYRADGAVLVDLMQRQIDTNIPMLNNIYALFKNNIEHSTRVPDIKAVLTNSQSGNPHSLVGLGQAQSLLYTWYFQRLDDPAENGYVFRGWENVDGRRCLHVQLDWILGLRGDNASTYHFWLDLERGGQPLRVEIHNGKHLAMRLSKVRLEQFPAKDGPIWLPVSGECDTFVTEAATRGEKVTHETYSFVDGSIRLNQGLPDEMFTVAWAVQAKGFGNEGSALREAREAFDGTPARPPLRTDRAGVQERLDKALELADLQAKELDASAAARAEGNPAFIFQVSLGAFGISALGVAAFWAWRRR